MSCADTCMVSYNEHSKLQFNSNFLFIRFVGLANFIVIHVHKNKIVKIKVAAKIQGVKLVAFSITIGIGPWGASSETGLVSRFYVNIWNCIFRVNIKVGR